MKSEYARTKSLRKTGAAVGLHKQTVRKILIANGIELFPLAESNAAAHSLTPEQVELIRRDKAAGKSYKEIQAAHGFGRHTIWKYSQNIDVHLSGKKDKAGRCRACDTAAQKKTPAVFYR